MSDGKNYQIVNLIAQGGTAVLFKAIQTSLDRVVAIKKLHHHLTQDENFTRRFILEAKAAASLDHENIVKIIDFGVEDHTYFMVMEFIEGESFRDILDKWKQIPENTALAIAHQVSQGLEHAHSKGIVHRDVKPGNIMLTQSGRIKITDFGLAKLTQATTQHTAANSILGTPLYMSPEQAFGESVDHRSDLFSLGTMLYEILTGHQPFFDENYMGIIQNIIHQNAPHPSKFNVELAPPVASILAKSMNKNRDARFQSAREFKKTIERHLGLATLNEASENLRGLLATGGTTIVLPKTERVRKKRRRLRLGLAAALTATAAFAAATIGYSLAPGAVNGCLSGIKSWLGDKPPTESPAQQSDLFGGSLPDIYVNPTPPDSGAVGVTTQPDQMVQVVAKDSTTKPKPVADSPAPPEPDPGESIADTVTTATASSEVETTKPAIDAAAEERAPIAEQPAEIVRTGWLAVMTSPSAEIYIDGVYQGDSPAARIQITGGSHTLECKTPGYETYYEVIKITNGELSTRNIVLTKLLGQVSIATLEGAEVYVDGTLIGVTPLAGPLELEAGRHQITVKKSGYNVWNNAVNLEAKQTLPLRITLTPMY
ncbi:MAG: protein kinase [Candidatus Latescibacterota bacterium]|nr:MAG: protein kinase [Candidatus Latescibacterota bacterium]